MSADVVHLPRKRYKPPDKLAFDFGPLIRERELVALAKKMHGGKFSSFRNMTRKIDLWLEGASGKYSKAVESGEDDDPEDEFKEPIVSNLMCSLGFHETTEARPGDAKRSLSETVDLLGVKW